MTQWVNPGLDQQLIGLGIAVGVGLIVGLEREWAEDKPVGVRTFALIGALGGLASLLTSEFGGWVVGAGLLALGVIIAFRSRGGEHGGMTTLVAALVVYLLGAAAVAGFWLHTIVLAGIVTVLLHWKKQMHKGVGKLGERDFEIIVRFILITLVILPILPDENYGPYEAFNPFNTWLLIVLIVAINLVGYVAFRLVGTRAGGWLAGVLGGLVSSTATTISYAGMTKRHRELGPVAVMVILVASTIVYARVLLELAVVSPQLVGSIAGPSAAFSVVLLALSAAAYFRVHRDTDVKMPKRGNPARIRQALIFGALYVLILYAVEAAGDLIGEDALYGVAFISGLTDVDALTLSIGRMFAGGGTSADVAWRAIFLGTLSNLFFKILAAAFLGSALLRKWVLATGAIALVAGAAILLLWP